MTGISMASAEPPALAALRGYPLLLASVEASMQQQSRRVLYCEQFFSGRAATLAELHHLLHTLKGGLVALEGPPGSGVTSLLAHLANTMPVAFWLSNDDARQGAAALVAQLIGLHRLRVPLIPPAVQSNPNVLEKFLADAATELESDSPLVLLLDPPACELQPLTPQPMSLLSNIPPGVLVIYGSTPGTTLPLDPAARVTLPLEGDELRADQARLLQQSRCPAEWIEPLIAASQGNMFYLRLAYGLLQQEIITPGELAPGLDTLHRVWWDSLDSQGQWLALLLAAAGEPMPIDVCTALSGADPRLLLARWSALGIAIYSPRTGRRSSNTDDHTAALAHWTTCDYLARQQGGALAMAHAEVVRLAGSLLHIDNPLHDDPEAPTPSTSTQSADVYLMRQFARHAALAPADVQQNSLPQVAERNWVRMQERRSDALFDAAHDAVWEFSRAAMHGPPGRLVRSAALAGKLTSLARTLLPDAAVEALHNAVEHFGREAGLKRINALLEQLPDGQPKALLLRRLGEACYSLQMRASAMRLLSQALDIEEQKLPANWREQRDQLSARLAEAALDLGEIDTALQISTRIDHPERRGMLETQIMRWLLAQGHLARAQEVASSIEHESLGAWAQAEVAVTLERAGDLAAAETLLAAIPSETARSWAEIELACDIAPRDEEAARRRIDQLNSPHQRDRGLARLARALAMADKDGDALDAAVQIRDVAARVSALLDLRLMLEGLVAMLALEQANAVIGKLPRDVRVPLISMLAASYAALGRREQSIRVIEQFTEGEERDRALSRVAVALAQHGDREEGLTIVRNLLDEDERDWALDELVHVFAEAGLWEEAHALCLEINADEQRAHTIANLAIARARAGAPLEALDIARYSTLLHEYARALRTIAPLLVAAGHSAAAIAIVEDEQAAHPLDHVQISRYQGIVVAALAEHSELRRARQVTRTIMQPLDRARAHLAIARVTVMHDQEQAFHDLGLALRGALLGHDEAFRLLDTAVPMLAQLGGIRLLQEVTEAIDHIDSW